MERKKIWEANQGNPASQICSCGIKIGIKTWEQKYTSHFTSLLKGGGVGGGWEGGGREGGCRVTQNNTSLRSASKREHTSTYSSVCELHRVCTDSRDGVRQVERHINVTSAAVCAPVFSTRYFINIIGADMKRQWATVSPQRWDYIFLPCLSLRPGCCLFVSLSVTQFLCWHPVALSLCHTLPPSLPPQLSVSLSLVGVIESSWAVRENTWCHFIGCKCLCSRLTINLQSANTCTCDFEHRPLWLPWPLSARWPELRHTPLHTHLTCIHF